MTEHRRRYEVNMEHVQHAGASYDHSDLGARGIVGFLIGLAVTVVFIHIIIWGFIRTYAYFEPKALPRTTAIMAPPPPRGNPASRFPAPQLQSDEAGDMDNYRQAVEQQLNSSGWINQGAGVAHIPVEHAIDLVAQRGLPVRPQEPQAQQAKFGSGDGSVAGAAGGTMPRGNK